MARDLHQTDNARDRDEELPEPPQIRRFRRLVSLSMIVMMIGILGIMGALVWKLTQTSERLDLPPTMAEFALPKDFQVIGVSRATSRLFLLLENSETGDFIVQERNQDDYQLLRQFRLVSE